jgi:hypothetical protein
MKKKYKKKYFDSKITRQGTIHNRTIQYRFTFLFFDRVLIEKYKSRV